MPELTPWFPADVKPIRPGVYATQYVKDVDGFSYWDGEKWGYQAEDVYRAGSAGYRNFCRPLRPWRGLAADPNA